MIQSVDIILNQDRLMNKHISISSSINPNSNILLKSPAIMNEKQRSSRVTFTLKWSEYHGIVYQNENLGFR